MAGHTGQGFLPHPKCTRYPVMRGRHGPATTGWRALGGGGGWPVDLALFAGVGGGGDRNRRPAAEEAEQHSQPLLPEDPMPPRLFGAPHTNAEQQILAATILISCTGLPIDLLWWRRGGRASREASAHAMIPSPPESPSGGTRGASRLTNKQMRAMFQEAVA